jgi:mono/diheme cytochrome c family protein
MEMRGLVVMTWLGVVSVAAPLAGQPERQPPAPTVTGTQLFKTYCASCHGVSGRGDGPVGPLLRRPPTDLTGYAQRNGGVFPTDRLSRIIDGRDVPSHGTLEMPVWGDVFKRSPGGEEAARARIDAIVKYLQSIQARIAH